MARLKFAYPVCQQPRCVTFSSGSLRTLVDEGPLDRTVLMLSGSTKVHAAVEAVLNRRDSFLENIKHLVKPQGEPATEMILQGADWLGRQDFDRLVAVGGGSVLDWARLCWAQSRGLLTLDSGKVAPLGAEALPPALWLVPTTCGSGAEAAAVAVYSHQGRKVPAVSPNFLADRVILDGHFLDSVSPGELACFLCDALSHAVESYVSIVPNYLAKESALSALQVILEQYAASPGTCRNERLMEAGYLGGVAASNCSVGVIHALAHSLSAWGVSHAVGNALGLLAGLRINASTEAMEKLLARLKLSSIDDLIAQMRPIVQAALSAQLKSTQLESATLARLQSSAGRSELISKMAGDVCLRTNPRPLSADDLAAFLDDVVELARV